MKKQRPRAPFKWVKTQNSAVPHFSLTPESAVLCGEKCKKCGVCAVKYIKKCGVMRYKTLNSAMQCGVVMTILFAPLHILYWRCLHFHESQWSQVDHNRSIL
jgi:hypothetical protein